MTSHKVRYDLPTGVLIDRLMTAFWSSPVSRVQVQADRAAAVPLAALVAALHPLDQPGWSSRRSSGRQHGSSRSFVLTSRSSSTSSVAAGEGGGESPGGACLDRRHRGGVLSSTVVEQRRSEGAVPRLPPPLAVKDAVDVERLPPGPPSRPVPPCSSGGAGL